MVMYRSLMSIVLSMGLLLPLQVYAQQQKDTESTPANQTTKQDSKSQKPAETQTPQPKSSNAEDNPFPEDVSRKAAEAAKQREENAPKAQPLSPGESSSSSNFAGWDADDNTKDQNDGNAEMPKDVRDPKRAAEDVKVGKFYMDTEDWKGAYDRFQDALHFEPDNADAAYGMAEAAARMNLSPQAIAAYKKYLDMDPDGPHAKASLKALKKLEGSDKKASNK